MSLNPFRRRDCLITFMCGEIDFACPSRRACDIDVNDNLINHSPSAASTPRISLARVAFVCPCKDAVATQLTGTNMRTVETPSAVGTGWRGSLSRLYRMIEALEASPMESLYDRVLRLEQEVSALKRNLPVGSVEHE